MTITLYMCEGYLRRRKIFRLFLPPHDDDDDDDDVDDGMIMTHYICFKAHKMKIRLKIMFKTLEKLNDYKS